MTRLRRWKTARSSVCTRRNSNGRPPPFARLLLLKHERRFLAQSRNETLGEPLQQPRQCDLDAQAVVEHLDRAGGGLAETAHLEAHGVAGPLLLIDGNQHAEVAAAHAVKP